MITFHGLKTADEVKNAIRQILKSANGPVDRVTVRNQLSVSIALMDECVHALADGGEATLEFDGNGWSKVQKT